MAEVNVSKQTKSGEQRQGGGLTRTGEFPFSPSEFFSMSPFALMRRMTDEMDRWFSGWGGTERERFWAPQVEVREQGGNLIVCADLPGLSKDDVKVEVTDEGLVIQGERKHEHEEKREGYYRSERQYGRFHRVIPLPEGAKLDQTRANFTNGVLEVTVPVPEQQHKRRQIQIEEGGGTRRAGGGGM